jgi:dipeptidyl aminopeptidase/acylaminoacyl peptidase
MSLDHNVDTHRRVRLLLAVGVVLSALLSVLASPAHAQAATAASRCSTSGTTLSCQKNTSTYLVAGEPRAVYWQTPTGTAPKGGWPTAILLQGTAQNPADSWSSVPSDPYGDYNETRLIQSLLDNGYAVLTPAAHGSGATFWDTNNPIWENNWNGSPDDQFMKLLFGRIDAGAFGPLAGAHLFVAGFSSGGYMTSRMTIAYPSRVVAIAIESASYATCLGSDCSVPATLPSTHAQTLFLHGTNDNIVPIQTMYAYNSALQSSGITTRVVVDSTAGHQWLNVAPSEVLSWFNSHRT